MIKIFSEKYEKIIKDAVVAAVEKLGNNVEDVDVEINVVDEEEIREINNQERGIDYVYLYVDVFYAIS